VGIGCYYVAGIGLAAVLFGALYQGGQELAFQMPQISQQMVLVIQALVILFTGAMEGLFRPGLERIFTALADRRAAGA